jgi:hypothetical protein
MQRRTVAARDLIPFDLRKAFDLSGSCTACEPGHNSLCTAGSLSNRELEPLDNALNLILSTTREPIQLARGWSSVRLLQWKLLTSMILEVFSSSWE